MTKIRLAGIAEAVARDYGISVADLRYGGRRRLLIEARWCAWWLARHLTAASLAAIGTFFRHNHTTVLHGVRGHRETMTNDPRVKSRTLRLARALKDGGADHHPLDAVAPSRLRLAPAADETKEEPPPCPTA